MRDEMSFVERVQRDLSDVRWPEPAEIRARARRRNRRTTLVAAVLVVATTSTVALLAGRLVPAPTTTSAMETTPTPVRNEIAWETLLQPGDLGVETDPPLTQAEIGAPVRVADLLLVCHESQGRTAAWETSRYSRSQTLLRQRPPGFDHPPSDVLLSQDVYRLAPEAAGRFFQSVGTLIAPCVAWRSVGPTQWGSRVVQAEAIHSWEAVERDFTGDESLLLRHTVTRARNLETGEFAGAAPKPTTVAVVRVGDLVTVLSQGRDGTEPDLRRLATLAARRLCVAANPPC
ncbi:hypothetical protein ACN26Y_03645 [Micromonospora sp. WMMD558]|uniref:hypothetical protein n=1 Tax=unclassified Micromonospora TaxID=2617518 RepID=UPI0012B4AA2C|nr:hypothetical protein [Micromonospora sp. WMMC415]QGN45431.1 hypothetical protein GKC29_00260 [Micromonospora sp. WMMC415]